MSYKNNSWALGDIITSSKLNALENGLKDTSISSIRYVSCIDEMEDLSKKDTLQDGTICYTKAEGQYFQYLKDKDMWLHDVSIIKGNVEPSHGSLWIDTHDTAAVFQNEYEAVLAELIEVVRALREEVRELKGQGTINPDRPSTDELPSKFTYYLSEDNKYYSSEDSSLYTTE